MKLEKMSFNGKDIYIDMEKVSAVWEQDDTSTGGSEHQVYIGLPQWDGIAVDGTLDDVASIVRYYNSRA